MTLALIRARLEHNPREHYHLAGLELDALWERRALPRLHVVGDAFDELESAVIAPDLARLLRHAPVGCHVLLRDRQYISINVSHKSSVSLLAEKVLKQDHSPFAMGASRNSVIIENTQPRRCESMNRSLPELLFVEFYRDVAKP